MTNVLKTIVWRLGIYGIISLIVNLIVLVASFMESHEILTGITIKLAGEIVDIPIIIGIVGFGMGIAGIVVAFVVFRVRDVIALKELIFG